jgi:hypothetical protein
MPHQISSFENKCKDVMDNSIKNLDSNLYQELLNELLISDIPNNKKSIEKFIRNKLNLFSVASKHAKQYWEQRGWSPAESHIKAKEYARKGHKSVYGSTYWLEKINPFTNKNYTQDEADFERNSRRPIRKEYWIKKGYSDIESIKIANDKKNFCQLYMGEGYL